MQAPRAISSRLHPPFLTYVSAVAPMQAMRTGISLTAPSTVETTKTIRTQAKA